MNRGDADHPVVGEDNQMGAQPEGIGMDSLRLPPHRHLAGGDTLCFVQGAPERKRYPFFRSCCPGMSFP